jgi:hypothetical protein
VYDTDVFNVTVRYGKRVKFVLEQAIKAQRNRGIALLFL